MHPTRPAMLPFLLDVLRRVRPFRILVVDDQTYREYRLTRRGVLSWLIALGVLGGVVAGLLMLFTPLRNVLLGYNPDLLQHEARLYALRVEALEDSLRMQQMYLERLRWIITGEVPVAAEGRVEETPSTPLVEAGEIAPEAPRVHLRPTILPAEIVQQGSGTSLPKGTLPLFRLYMPVQGGVVTRGFTYEHPAVDIAAEEGTPVRAMAEGQVVFADWTHESGYVLVLQHEGGYLTVYKHNRRLLFQPGARVKQGEVVAFSGNTGETTTGPHVHVECWYNGIPLDPLEYMINL